MFVVGNLAMWRSKMQNVVARSSEEADLRSVAHGVSEVMMIKVSKLSMEVLVRPSCL